MLSLCYSNDQSATNLSNKDRFFKKVLPANVAACSGNWFYTDLIGLAKCATEYMKANERYTEGSTFLGNLKDTTVSSISNRSLNFQLYRPPLRNFYKKNQKQLI